MSAERTIEQRQRCLLVLDGSRRMTTTTPSFQRQARCAAATATATATAALRAPDSLQLLSLNSRSSFFLTRVCAAESADDDDARVRAAEGTNSG